MILGFALVAAVVDSQQQQDCAESRLNDPAWIAYCARRYRSFDTYTGTYFGADGLRHYCRWGALRTLRASRNRAFYSRVVPDCADVFQRSG